MGAGSAGVVREPAGDYTRPRTGAFEEAGVSTDRQLLDRYVSEGARDAFAEIVRRHTDRVYAACLRLLGDPHLAEDAVQATFLVLVRKARRIRPGAVLADWLFWTARHCAQEIRRAGRRRAAHEREAAMSRSREGTPAGPDAGGELRAQLDLALAALPASQRQAAVLHYFYGRTQQEIAREVGCPRTTVTRRISSALEKLRRGLSRRGVALSAAALTAALAEEAAVTAPAGLAASVEAACLGGAAASSLAAGAAQGAVKAMAVAKIKLAAAVLCTAAVAASGGTATVRALTAGRPAESDPEAGQAAGPAAASPMLRKILEMPADSWLAVPDSKMRKVTFTQKQLKAMGIRGVEGPSAVIADWSGAAYDGKRHRLILWGGGHNGYYGNELYAFNVPSLKWERLTDPGRPRANAYQVCGPLNADGSPVSRHTYNTLAYIAHADRFFGHGGSLACGLGSSGFGTTWTFDFAATKWHQMKPEGTFPPGTVSSFCAYDPETKKIWYQDGNLNRPKKWGLYSYDYDGNAWTKHNSQACCSQTCVVEPRKRLLIGVGNGRVRCWDIGKADYAMRELKTTGGDPVVGPRNPGLAFDPVSGKIVAWHGGPVCTLDLDSNRWEAHEAKGAPEPAKWGTFGRWQYSPLVDAFIVVNDIDQDVHFYRLGEGR
jgi:RNA polymerase sigma factor (sigma-70 family)